VSPPSGGGRHRCRFAPLGFPLWALSSGLAARDLSQAGGRAAAHSRAPNCTLAAVSPSPSSSANTSSAQPKLGLEIRLLSAATCHWQCEGARHLTATCGQPCSLCGPPELSPGGPARLGCPQLLPRRAKVASELARSPVQCHKRPLRRPPSCNRATLGASARSAQSRHRAGLVTKSGVIQLHAEPLPRRARPCLWLLSFSLTLQS